MTTQGEMSHGTVRLWSFCALTRLPKESEKQINPSACLVVFPTEAVSHSGQHFHRRNRPRVQDSHGDVPGRLVPGHGDTPQEGEGWGCPLLLPFCSALGKPLQVVSRPVTLRAHCVINVSCRKGMAASRAPSQAGSADSSCCSTFPKDTGSLGFQSFLYNFALWN